MKESREVKKLRSKILGMEMELCLISKDLERFKNELFYNTRMLKKTKENIEFLQDSDSIVSLPEFKKIKQQEDLIQKRIKYYTKKIQPLKQLLIRKEAYHKEEMTRFESVYRLQFQNNILEFPDVRRKEA